MDGKFLGSKILRTRGTAKHKTSKTCLLRRSAMNLHICYGSIIPTNFITEWLISMKDRWKRTSPVKKPHFQNNNTHINELSKTQSLSPIPQSSKGIGAFTLLRCRCMPCKVATTASRDSCKTLLVVEPVFFAYSYTAYIYIRILHIGKRSLSKTVFASTNHLDQNVNLNAKLALWIQTSLCWVTISGTGYVLRSY